MQMYESPLVVHSTIESEGYGKSGVRPLSGMYVAYRI